MKIVNNGMGYQVAEGKIMLTNFFLPAMAAEAIIGLHGIAAIRAVRCCFVYNFIRHLSACQFVFCLFLLGGLCLGRGIRGLAPASSAGARIPPSV